MQIRFLAASALAALSFTAANLQPAHTQTVTAPSESFELHLEEVYNKRRGGEIESSVVFRDPLTREHNPTLTVTEGERVTIKLVNRTHDPRAFAIMGVKGAASHPVAAGATTTVQFTAPARGAYIYHDPGQASIPDTRSLFGDFIVTAKPGH